MAKQIGKSHEIVYRAITDLFEHSQYAHRERLVTITHLTQCQVDESIKRLKERDMIRSTTPGYFEPVDQTVDRAISATYLPMGRVKLEIGDEVCDFTPREWLQVAKLAAGAILAFASPSTMRGQ